jgi:hypothetical protein
MLVQLPAQRPGAAIEDDHPNVELSDVVRRLEPEQAGTDDHGRTTATSPNVLLQLNGVVDCSQHEAAFGAETVDGRNDRCAPVAITSLS